jgi:ABC-2 type transport system ATP-binding protein
MILKTEALTKRYGRRKVVDNLALQIERGDIFGFLGQNGAGKSTVIRMILGLVRPTAGRIHLFRQDARQHPLKVLGRIGAIVEAPAFYENFSGRQNLRMFASMSGGLNGKQVEDTLNLVSLRDRANDPVRTYSHGMKQRLGIAQALLPRPEFVILDEPTDGLDPQGIQDVRSLLLRLRDERGLTIMLSSHLLFEVERLCNRIGIINEGQLLYQGATHDLITNEKTIRITAEPLDDACQLLRQDLKLSVSRNGSKSIYVKLQPEHVPELNALLVAKDIRVMELAPQQATLEEVFMALTQKKTGR